MGRNKYANLSSKKKSWGPKSSVALHARGGKGHIPLESYEFLVTSVACRSVRCGALQILDTPGSTRANENKLTNHMASFD